MTGCEGNSGGEGSSEQSNAGPVTKWMSWKIGCEKQTSPRRHQVSDLNCWVNSGQENCGRSNVGRERLRTDLGHVE